MQNAEAVLAVLKSLESPVHPKVPAGFGGRLRGKGPQQRDLAAQPILLLEVLLQYHREVALSGDQELVEAFPAEGADEALGDGVGPRCPDWSADDGNVGAGECLVIRSALHSCGFRV